MKSIGRKTLIIAVAFFALLIVSSGAQASGLFALDGNQASAQRQIGLFHEAFQWLSGTWTDLTSVFAYSEEPPPPPTTQECTTNCEDAGAGIDPEG